MSNVGLEPSIGVTDGNAGLSCIGGTPINFLPNPTPPYPHPPNSKMGPPALSYTLFCSNDHVFLRIASLLKHFSIQKSGCVLSALLVI
jgi:hypothetical protein